jgi:hypothetical protein
MEGWATRPMLLIVKVTTRRFLAEVPVDAMAVQASSGFLHSAVSRLAGSGCGRNDNALGVSLEHNIGRHTTLSKINQHSSPQICG